MQGWQQRAPLRGTQTTPDAALAALKCSVQHETVLRGDHALRITMIQTGGPHGMRLNSWPVLSYYYYPT